MTILSTKTLSAAALAAGIALFAGVDGAQAGHCPVTICGLNGTQLSGLRVLQAAQPVVTTVTLPSGEKLELAR